MSTVNRSPGKSSRVAEAYQQAPEPSLAPGKRTRSSALPGQAASGGVATTQAARIMHVRNEDGGVRVSLTAGSSRGVAVGATVTLGSQGEFRMQIERVFDRTSSGIVAGARLEELANLQQATIDLTTAVGRPQPGKRAPFQTPITNPRPYPVDPRDDTAGRTHMMMDASWSGAKGVGRGSRAWLVQKDGTQRACEIHDADSDNVIVKCVQHSAGMSDEAQKALRAQYLGAILYLE